MSPSWPSLGESLTTREHTAWGTFHRPYSFAAHKRKLLAESAKHVESALQHQDTWANDGGR